MKPQPITTNDKLIDILDSECKKFTDKYFPLHQTQIKTLKAATALVDNGKDDIRKNPGKARATTILTDLWTHVPDVFVLCALATNQTSLGALKTTDYIKHVQNWCEGRAMPRGLLEISHFHANLLPNSRGISDFVTATTTVARLADLMHEEHGDTPLVITCPFGGQPPPFIQIGRKSNIKVELSMEACSKLVRASNGGS